MPRTRSAAASSPEARRSLTRSALVAIGADGWAAALADADELLVRWQHEDDGPEPPALPGRAAAASLLASQTMLVDRAMATLQDRLPVMATFTERRVNRTRADFC